jgi:hypothetical protein
LIDFVKNKNKKTTKTKQTTQQQKQNMLKQKQNTKTIQGGKGQPQKLPYVR